MQGHLALCCKATLPVLGMGRVGVTTGEQQRERPLVQATRCLVKQPGGVSHLEVVSSITDTYCLDTRHLIDFRCAHALVCLCPCAVTCMSVPLLLLCCGQDITHVGTDDNGAVRFRSLLTNLRKLILRGVAVSLPALQPVATRLHQLDLTASRLHGSSDGFLTRGWTALTTLSLADARVETASMTAALELPALEELDTLDFRHQGGVLQLDQLTGNCPNIRKLRLRVDNDLARGREGRAPCCSLMSLGRLADLYMEILTWGEPINADLDFDLPASLMRFEVGGVFGGGWVFNFFWALREAMKCVRRGAQLRRVSYACIGADMQPAQ